MSISRQLYRLFIGLLLASLGLHLAEVTSPVTAQRSGLSWEDPQSIGEDLSSSWFPEIHADAAGNVRITWESVRDPDEPGVEEANGGAIMLSELQEGEWSRPADIYVKDILNAGRPIMASDGQYLHVVSRSPRAEGRITIQMLSAIYYMRAPLTSDLTNAHSWSEPVRMTSGAAYWARMEVLDDGTIVLVYNHAVDIITSGTLEVRTALFSRRSTDGGDTWSDPVQISDSSNRVARSSLVVSPTDNTLIVSWDEGYDNLTGRGTAAGIYTSQSTDGGVSWSAASRIGRRVDDPVSSELPRFQSDAGTVEQSTLATSDDLTMLVYRSTVTDELFYRLSEDLGETWSEERQIPRAAPRPFVTSHHFDKLALAVDGDGRIVFVYVGADPDAPEGLSVMSMTYFEDRWSRPSVVAAPEGFPEYPRLTIIEGNQMHLAYFVRDRAFVDSGHYVIWATQGTTPAEHVPIREDAVQRPAVAERSTPTPEPAPTAFEWVNPIVFPTPPPAPAPVEDDDDPSTPQQTVVRPVIYMAGATGGALLLAGIAATALRRWQG